MFAATPGYDSLCNIFIAKNFHLPAKQEASRDFDLSARSRDNPLSFDTVQTTKRKTTLKTTLPIKVRQKICSESGKGTLNDSKRCEMKKRQGLALGSTSDNNDLTSGISDSRSSKEVCFHEDILAVPCPSTFRDNWKHRILCGESQPSYSQEIPSVKVKEKTLCCRVCKKEVREHLNVENNLYRCCVCIFVTCKQGNLKMHSYTHCPKKNCGICEKEYIDGDSHESEYTCNECKKTFHCKNQYNEHVLDHPEYFKAHCWLCTKSIDCHFITYNKRPLYKCCVCKYKDYHKSNLKKHNQTHRPKIFCKICLEDYDIKEKQFHKSDYICSICKKKFQCKSLLEDHYEDHEEYFSHHCRLCDREICNHIIEYEEKSFYKCCNCLFESKTRNQLQRHLHTHTGLRLFKCSVCGKRFAYRDSLARHSLSCGLLPYRCEICRKRFADDFSLNAHYLTEHRETCEGFSSAEEISCVG